jgi:hypothetical protein
MERNSVMMMMRCGWAAAGDRREGADMGTVVVLECGGVRILGIEYGFRAGF